MSEMNTSEKYYSIPEAAKELGLSQQLLRNAINKNELNASQIPFSNNMGYKYMVCESNLLKWLEHRDEFKAERKKNRPKRTRRTKAFVAKKYEEMSITEFSEEFAGQFLNKIQEAYNAGIKEGERRMKAKIMEALK